MFEKHKLFRILPVFDLASHAYAAVAGARYHYQRMQQLVRCPGWQTIWQNDTALDVESKNRRQGDVNAFMWELRAFFWELHAGFEMLLQWANQRYELGIDEDKVDWKGVTGKATKANKDQSEWTSKFAILRVAYDSGWHYDIRQYRNFVAHRAFHFVQGEYDGHYGKSEPTFKRVWLVPTREGQDPGPDILAAIPVYIDKMQALLNDILPK